MQLPRVVILAAGRGTRLRPGLGETLKPLAPFDGELLLERNLRQLTGAGFTDISVVTGYRGEEIAAVARQCRPATKIIVNDLWDKDRNVYSLALGLVPAPEEPCLALDGDVAFAEDAIPRLAAYCQSGQSAWLANGRYLPEHKYDVLKTDAKGWLTDVLYQPEADQPGFHLPPEHPGHIGRYRNLGAVFIGPGQAGIFYRALRQQAEKDLDSYYLTPWVENIAELPARVLNLGPAAAATFNTPEEYEAALNLVCLAPAGAFLNRGRAGAVSGGGRVIWITGLSGAGKTSLARALAPLLEGPVLWYDGDVLGRALEPVASGYDRENRLAQGRACSRLYKIGADQGLTVICSTITMMHEIQDWNRENLPGYFEVFLDVDEEVRLARDYKRVYRQSSSPVVGRQIPAEYPRRPEMHLVNPPQSPEELARLVFEALSDGAVRPAAADVPIEIRA